MAFEGFPLILGWELTLACNLRCKHCASSAGNRRPGELSREELLLVADQLPDLLVQEVVFTGGEPLLSPDLPAIGARLQQLGIRSGFVTNGTLLSRSVAAKLLESGISAAAVSVDGLEATHDLIRGGRGLFHRTLEGIGCLIQSGFQVTAITTVSSMNLRELAEVGSLLAGAGVTQWQLQPLFALGRTRQEPQLRISESEFLELGRFIQKHRQSPTNCSVRLVPADGCGYFSDFDVEQPRWRGCSAGIATCGITSDGKVKGCLSWPDSMIEGDVRTDELWKIWFSPDAFSCTRNFTHGDLGEACRSCEMASMCGGGCTAMSIASTGRPHADPYCYRQIMSRPANRDLRDDRRAECLTDAQHLSKDNQPAEA